MGRAYVHYELGNFLWYAKGGPDAGTGVLTVTLEGEDVVDAEWTLARISGGKTTPLTGDAAEAAGAEWEAVRDCTDLSASPPADTGA
jgi:hypothetical protein